MVVELLLQVYWVQVQLKQHLALLALLEFKVALVLNWLARDCCLLLLQCLEELLLLRVHWLLKG
jgi:hypothetical protein